MREDLFCCKDGWYSTVNLVTINRRNDAPYGPSLIDEKRKKMSSYGVRTFRFFDTLKDDLELLDDWIWTTSKFGKIIRESPYLKKGKYHYLTVTEDKKSEEIAFGIGDFRFGGTFYVGPKLFWELEEILYMSPFYLYQANISRHNVDDEKWNYLTIEFRLLPKARKIKYDLFPNDWQSDNRLYWNSVDFIRGILTWYFPEMDVSGYWHNDKDNRLFFDLADKKERGPYKKTLTLSDEMKYVIDRYVAYRDLKPTHFTARNSYLFREDDHDKRSSARR